MCRMYSKYSEYESRIPSTYQLLRLYEQARPFLHIHLRVGLRSGHCASALRSRSCNSQGCLTLYPRYRTVDLWYGRIQSTSISRPWGLSGYRY